MNGVPCQNALWYFLIVIRQSQCKYSSTGLLRMSPHCFIIKSRKPSGRYWGCRLQNSFQPPSIFRISFRKSCGLTWSGFGMRFRHAWNNINDFSLLMVSSWQMDSNSSSKNIVPFLNSPILKFLIKNEESRHPTALLHLTSYILHPEGHPSSSPPVVPPPWLPPWLSPPSVMSSSPDARHRRNGFR